MPPVSLDLDPLCCARGGVSMRRVPALLSLSITVLVGGVRPDGSCGRSWRALLSHRDDAIGDDRDNRCPSSGSPCCDGAFAADTAAVNGPTRARRITAAVGGDALLGLLPPRYRN